MYDPTSLLFGLKEFQVVEVAPVADQDQVKVTIEMIDSEAACPTCGVFSAQVKDRPQRRIKDLPASGQPVELWWRKRCLKCVQESCPTKSFTQASQVIKPRGRLSERLREKLAVSIARSNRSVSDVAREYGVSWPTANKALTQAVARWLPEPEPTRVLGIDDGARRRHSLSQP